MVVLGKFIKWLFLGALIGVGVTIGLYALGFGIELLNCTCAILACNFDANDAIPMMWNGNAFGSLLSFCVIGGAVIGGIYGFVTGVQDKKEQKLMKERNNVEAVLRQLSGLEDYCGRVSRQLDDAISNMSYVADDEKTKSEKVVLECGSVIEKLTQDAAPRSQ